MLSYLWSNLTNLLSLPPTGALPEDHRKEWVPGPTLGAIYHAEWRLPVAHQLDL